MVGKIIMLSVSLICGLLFFFIGIYARRLDKPMWFWSDSHVDPSRITDLKGYNKENGIMWQAYSLWYFASCGAAFFNIIISLVFLVLSCTVGIGLLIGTYNRICKKYMLQ